MAVTLKTRIWLEGLMRAFFSGMSGYFGVDMIVDFETIWQKFAAAGVLGLIALVQYLSQKPLPDPEDKAWSPAESPMTQLFKGTGPGTGGVLLALTLGGSLVVAGCALRGTVATSPTPDQTQSVRVLALRVTDATKAGETIARDLGRQIDSLPLSPEDKNKYDCALVKVMGSATPLSATVMQVCGAPDKRPEDAPLGVALKALAAVASCPSLRSTVATLNEAVNPLIAALYNSSNQVIRMAGVSLQATFALLTTGGVTCSV